MRTTPATVIRAIYEALDGMGFEKGNILEPSMGVGNFFGMLPDSMLGSRLYGVELDSITGRIAQKLYPQAEIKVAGFETTDRRDFYDLPWAMCLLATTVSAISHMINSDFLSTTISLPSTGSGSARWYRGLCYQPLYDGFQNPDARKYLAQRQTAGSHPTS